MSDLKVELVPLSEEETAVIIYGADIVSFEPFRSWEQGIISDKEGQVIFNSHIQGGQVGRIVVKTRKES